MKGKCYRGDKCNFSHEQDDIDHLKISNGATRKDLETSEALLKDFRWRIPKQTAGAKPLGYSLGKFFQQALELIDGEVGTTQEVITLLTSDGGLLRIEELLEQPFDSFRPAQLTRLIKAQLMPFFEIFSHVNVTSSILLRAKVMTVYNIMYTSDGDGQRIISLFTVLADHLSNPDVLYASQEEGEVNIDMLAAIETTLAVLSKLIEVNTPAHTNPGFISIVETFAKLLNDLPESVTFDVRKGKKNLERLEQQLGIGKAVPDAQKIRKSTGARATFQLAREMPGELSEEGRRHDNDHVDIQDISILPTLQEIQSSRNEYLPVTDPREWHFGGILGLVDRHFRLLREDTIGQLRDAAKFELERLQNPYRQIQKPNHSSARTYVYDNVYVVATAFDKHYGAQVAMRFDRPEANDQESKNARKEWWSSSKRLGPDALICLLSSEGSAMFFVVASQGHKPTQLQTEYDLVSDPDNAYLVAKPSNQSDLHELLPKGLGATTYAQLSIVEFPGVLLPSFEHTLKAMQRISINLDMPFPHILAPTSTPENPDRDIVIQPPAYASKPGFRYDLSTITTDNKRLRFAPNDAIIDKADQLAQMSTLDLGQAVAVISSLARSVALVQGPPGTGKSFTNHALDAILERSVDDDVANIVRIGGRSKSERLQDVNLKILAERLDLTKTEKTERWKLIKKVKKETAEIENLLDAFGSLGSESSIANHLSQNYPAYHSEIFSSTDEDGYTTVTYKQGLLVDIWLKTSCPGRWRPRPLDELHDVPLREMIMAERRIIFNSWVSEMRDELHEKLRHALASYNESQKELEVIKAELNLRVLRQANIIGITTSGLARNIDLLCGVNSKVLICEEAGEVLEAHMLTALLPSIEHCMLLGDHQQLRPQVQNFDLSTESHSGGQYALDISLFERLVQPQNILAQPLPFCTLEVQRRMHPSVSQLVRRTQYPNLQDDPSVFLYPEVVGMRRRLFWMHHDEPEDDNSDGHSTSRTNEYEVRMIVALVKHLTQQGVYKSTDIAVITPYLGQLRKLRNRFNTTHAIVLNDRDISELEKEGVDIDEASSSPQTLSLSTTAKGFLNQALRLATIDNFQGEEAKVIIVSLVRSNRKNNPGFLKTPNRINVLLSRAQHGMYIFGNTSTMDSVPMWHDVMRVLRHNDNIGDALELCCPRHQHMTIVVQSPADFARLSPEAGCTLLCDKQLECGHACVAKCHSDMLHGLVYCMKPCTRLKNGCQHLCPKPCGDKCDLKCQVTIENIEITLSCGHEKTSLLCHEYQDPSSVVCKEPMKRTVPGCNHDIVAACHIDVNHKEFLCFATCGQALPCGHVCQKPCYQCQTRVHGEISEMNHGKCMQKCDRGYNTCKHTCTSTCHQGEPCPLCTENCDTWCSHAHCSKLCSEACSPCLEEHCSSGLHCPHTETCPMPCAAPCTWIPCSERCDKFLSCGCRCPSVCGEQCPDASYCQEHGSDDVKDMQADLLMFTAYKDIDLDVDPCIFTPCGHIFTVDSLDGTMGMQEHYEVDPLTGQYTKVKSSAEPFSIKDSKPCPECRGSLRNLARYGRIVRRALLDESAKKLTVWSNHRHQELANRLVGLEVELMESLDFPRKPIQNIKLNGTVQMQIKSVKELKTTKRYSKMYALINEITHFVRKLSKDEQPYKRVHDLVEMARRQSCSTGSIAEFELSSEELQLRENLQAANLLIRSYLILFGDVINVHNETPVGTQGNLHVNFAEIRVLCEELVENAIESKSLRQKAEAQVLWAKLAAIECGVFEKKYEAENPGLQHRVDLLKLRATEHLDEAEEVCTEQETIANAHSMENIANEAAEVRRMLREGISSTEMRMVVTVMAKEFGGTGHWYRCVNAHPFTVGGCGMPMELARCPECGAGVGGQSHRPTEGVTRANDIEERFGDLAL
ncbi:hypothetical protein P280DRAFT_527699 [Massarina eburnea CBS 473.64]|uniref:Uncharacterized protein n=1 Tax=Massarina eburnea CBS 473.64 TaxID=1395130 RepID=A0A6A6RZ18_9PLEO|nr:hypothetical protein P280DRAFT_527699 [Massarina eburnea CBS 473.64]